MDGWLNKHVEEGHLPFMEPLPRKENITNNIDSAKLCGCIMTIIATLVCRAFNNGANAKSFDLSCSVLLS